MVVRGRHGARTRVRFTLSLRCRAAAGDSPPGALFPYRCA